MTGTARPMIDADGQLRGGVLVFRDVTEQKAARESLRRAKDEAEAANRAKSEFLSRMSHELRTPMNAILGFAQLLEDEALTSEQQDGIARILKAARHLLGLINEVLDISRIEAGRLNLQIERFAAFEVVQFAIELMAPLAAQRGIELLVPVCDASRGINADRQRLTQILVNLLGNAIKYNRERGQVKVSFEQTQERSLRINIADTGFGIAPELLNKLFVPFERLGAERSGIEGTGLGLAHSNRLISAMGGRIGVESEVAKGSVFWIEIPLSVEEARIDRSSLSSSGPASGSGASLDFGLATILYIQDDPTSFREVETIFSRLPGYGLVSAEQGRIGLSMALEHLPELVLLV
jgi:signal transduction histidine kinase